MAWFCPPCVQQGSSSVARWAMPVPLPTTAAHASPPATSASRGEVNAAASKKKGPVGAWGYQCHLSMSSSRRRGGWGVLSGGQRRGKD